MSKYFNNEDIEDLKLLKIHRVKKARRDFGVGYNVMERIKKDYREFVNHLSEREKYAFLELLHDTKPTHIYAWLQYVLLDMEFDLDTNADLQCLIITDKDNKEDD